jgi:hypothetical protein
MERVAPTQPSREWHRLTLAASDFLARDHQRDAARWQGYSRRIRPNRSLTTRCSSESFGIPTGDRESLTQADLGEVPLRQATTPERVHAPCRGRFGATGAENQCELKKTESFLFTGTASGNVKLSGGHSLSFQLSQTQRP